MKSLANLQRAKANLEAEEAAAKKTKPQPEAKPEANIQQTKAEAPAQKKTAQPKTWKSYYEARGMEYTQPKSGVGEADRRAAEIIKQNEQKAAALRQEALYHAERINKPFTTSAAQIDKQLGIGHKNPVSPNYAEEYAKLMDEKYGKLPEQTAQTNRLPKAETPAQKKTAEPKTWKKYLNERCIEYTQPKSGVGEADRRAAGIIKQNEQQAVHNNAPAEVPVENKNLQRFHLTNLLTPANIWSCLMQNTELLKTETLQPVPPQKPGKPAEAAAEKGEKGVKKAVKDGAKKPGFFCPYR